MPRFLILLLLPALFVPATSLAGGDKAQLTVISSGSVYGDPYSCECETAPVGGLPQRVAQVGTLVETHTPALWVDAGNGLFDGPGAVPAELMVPRRLKAITLVDAYGVGELAAHNVGRWDLAEGVEYLHRLALRASFPMLSANLWWTDDVPQTGLHFEPNLLIQLPTDGGDVLKVGVVGVMSDKQQGFGWRTSDPIKAAKEQAAALRDRGADYVVILAALPNKEAAKLARKVKAADLVIRSGPGDLPDEGLKAGRGHLVRSPARGRGLSLTELGGKQPLSSVVEVDRDGPQHQRSAQLMQELKLRLALPFDPPKEEADEPPPDLPKEVLQPGQDD